MCITRVFWSSCVDDMGKGEKSWIISGLSRCEIEIVLRFVDIGAAADAEELHGQLVGLSQRHYR